MVMDDGEMYNLSGLAQGDFDILVNNESQSALCELESFSQDHRASANAIRVFCPPATPPPHPRFPSPNHDVAHRREGGCGKDSIQRQGRGREYKRTPEEPSTIGISGGGTGGGLGGWLAKHMDGAGTFYSWESHSYYLRLKRRLKRSGRATRFPNSAASPVLQK